MEDLEVMKGGKLKERITEILSIDYPLSAKRLYNNLKANYQISVSYQAVYKALKEMENNGILTCEDKLYKISFEWLNRIDDFSERVRRSYLKRPIFISRIKVISFDLDGCLSNNAFDEIIWRRRIPEIYAKEKGLSFDKAFEEVTKEYKRLWGKVTGWRDVEFWFRHFGFKTTWQDMENDLKHCIKLYGDVIPVLRELHKRFKLIVISHADRKFLDLKLEVSDVARFIDQTYSTISDFKEYKKSKEIFLKVCSISQIEPNEMVHIGDSYEYDYKIPTSVGIKSFLINRIGTEKEDHVVRDLIELRSKLYE